MSLTSVASGSIMGILALLAAIEALWLIMLRRRLAGARKSLQRAADAAVDAIHAASLAAPGGIDPEIVLGLLRKGHVPSLDLVRHTMDERAEADERERRKALRTGGDVPAPATQQATRAPSPPAAPPPAAPPTAPPPGWPPAAQ